MSGGRPSRKQLLQQLANQKRKIVNRHQQKADANSQPLSQDMIDEAIIRSSIDRLQSLLPSRKGECTKPPSPYNLPKSTINDIPYLSNKSTVPWMTVSNAPVSLSEELRMFAAYVSVSDSHLLSMSPSHWCCAAGLC
jgi:hypothetical protein